MDLVDKQVRKAISMIISSLAGTPNVILLNRIAAQDLCRDWESPFKIDIRNELKGNKAIFQYRYKEAELQLVTTWDIFASPSLYATLQPYCWYYMPRRCKYGVAIENLGDPSVGLWLGRGGSDKIASIKLPARIEITRDPEMQKHTESLPALYLYEFESRILMLKEETN